MKHTLLAYVQTYTNNPQRQLQLFALGAVLFFIGAGCLVGAEHYIPPSVKQELIALLGLALLVIGALIAACGYLALSVLRLLKLMKKDDSHHE